MTTPDVARPDSAETPPDPCGGVHNFVYQGIKHAEGANPLPGTGARRVYYADHYFCCQCLVHRYERMSPDIGGSTYESVKWGATPGPVEEIVPQYDQRYGYR